MIYTMLMDYESLMKKAMDVSKNAYVPYSKFPVGACVLSENDKVFIGCNFENASYGLTICAERNAIGNAIANGETKLKAVAIYSPKLDDCVPCGACRQVMNEFQCCSGLDVITNTKDGIKVQKLSVLFPEGFKM